MTKKGRGNPDFLNGLPELLVLKLLSDDEMYGYQIVKAIKEKSDEQLEISDGCIYPLLHQLEEQGYLDTSRKEVHGRERYYYTLNEKGEKRLKSLATEWNDVVEGVLEVFDKGDEKPAII